MEHPKTNMIKKTKQNKTKQREGKTNVLASKEISCPVFHSQLNMICSNGRRTVKIDFMFINGSDAASKEWLSGECLVSKAGLVENVKCLSD